MDVLFVCRANLGRSQMTQALFNRISKYKSTSAGTKVDEFEGQTLAQRAEIAPSVVMVLDLMGNEEGLDLSSEQRTQLTPGLVDASDRVIVMAERDTWPDYLVEGGKVEFWQIADAVNIQLEAARAIKNDIKARVEELVRETG